MTAFARNHVVRCEGLVLALLFIQWFTMVNDRATRSRLPRGFAVY